jgi:predicted amidohydrolase
MKIQVAAVNAKIVLGRKGCDENLLVAEQYIKESVARSAQIICFPETFPGPTIEPFEGFSPHAFMSQMAREKNVYLVYGLAERVDPASDAAHYITECLVDNSGKLVGKYHRCCPPGPWRYKGGNFWDVNYVAADELPVFETDLGRIAMLVCSEVYMPELSRCMAIQGAEITFLPAGRVKGKSAQLYDTWKTLIKARAFENIMYTVTCQNVQTDERALAMICAPDELVACTDKEGVIVAQCDLDRVREMRLASDYEDFEAISAAYGTKTGTLREWRRPKIYLDILGMTSVESK